MKSLHKRYRVEVIVHEVVKVDDDDPEFKLVTQAECDFMHNILEIMRGDANGNAFGPGMIEKQLEAVLHKIRCVIEQPVIDYAMDNTAL